MIPGKVFFESINVSQQLSKRYDVCLLMNGIFYDKIKLFQSKYLCVTANDLLEVQLGMKADTEDQSGDEQGNFSGLRERSDNADSNFTNQILQQKTSAYLKVVISQTYKLLIESKTIEIKFQLNKKNNYEEIKINLAFEPVSSFSRKKLGATLNSTKNVKKPSSNSYNNRVLAHFQNPLQSSYNNTYEYKEGDSVISHDQIFPEELDFSRRRTKDMNATDMFSPSQNLQRSKEKGFGMMSKYSNNFFQANNHFINEKPLNQKQANQTNNKPKSKEKHPTFNLKLQTKNEHQFNHTINTDIFSDLLQNQVFTSRTDHQKHHNARENIKISEDYADDPQGDDETIEQHYQTQGNYRSLEMPSQMDTLESLAYQREKILGELFGKFSHRNKR